MSEYQVTCTTKSPSGYLHEHITHIGGTAGQGWWITKEDAIQRIESKSANFLLWIIQRGKKSTLEWFAVTEPRLPICVRMQMVSGTTTYWRCPLAVDPQREGLVR
jgi:hypothetical protein